MFRILKRPDEKMASKSQNANFSREEKLLLAKPGKQYCNIENKGYDNVSLKMKQSSSQKLCKVSPPEIPMVTSAIWKQFGDVGSARNWKRKRNLMSNGGKARRQVVVKPRFHQMLLVSWLLTLFQRQWIHWKIFYSSKGLSLSRKCRILRTRRVLAHCCRRLYLKLPSMTKTFTNKTLDYV